MEQVLELELALVLKQNFTSNSSLTLIYVVEAMVEGEQQASIQDNMDIHRHTLVLSHNCFKFSF